MISSKQVDTKNVYMSFIKLFSKENTEQKRIRSAIARYVDRVLIRFSSHLQRQFEKLPKSGKVMSFWIFVLLFTAGLVKIAYHSIYPSNSDQHISFDTSHSIKAPVARGDFSGGELKVRREILQLQLFLDSIKQDPEGKALYDSLVSRRPGLFDSLKTVKAYLGIK